MLQLERFGQPRHRAYLVLPARDHGVRFALHMDPGDPAQGAVSAHDAVFKVVAGAAANPFLHAGGQAGAVLLVDESEENAERLADGPCFKPEQNSAFPLPGHRAIEYVVVDNGCIPDRHAGCFERKLQPLVYVAHRFSHLFPIGLERGSGAGSRRK